MRECNKGYSMLDQEDRNFTVGWSDLLENTTDTEPSRLDTSFWFRSMLELKGLPYWGIFATYSGGGYVADLGTTERQARTLIEDLDKYNWLDPYTKAIFLEFTTYNPNINLFSYVLYLIEFPPIGGSLALPRIVSFQVRNDI